MRGTLFEVHQRPIPKWSRTGIYLAPEYVGSLVVSISHLITFELANDEVGEVEHANGVLYTLGIWMSNVTIKDSTVVLDNLATGRIWNLFKSVVERVEGDRPHVYPPGMSKEYLINRLCLDLRVLDGG